MLDGRSFGRWEKHRGFIADTEKHECIIVEVPALRPDFLAGGFETPDSGEG
jgi:hypothetical protein